MNVLLVAGCAAAGGAAGFVSYPWAARVAPAATAAQREDPLTPTSGAPDFTAEPPAAPEAPTDPEQAPTGPEQAPTGPEQAPTDPEAPTDRVAPPARTIERVGATVATAALLGAAAFHFGAVPVLAAYCVLFAGLVLVSVVDLRVGLVPRKMLYPALGLQAVALFAASAVNGHWQALGDAAACGIGAFLVFFAIWWFYPRGMGFGDVRLSGVTGSALGWLGLLHAYVGFLVSFVGGALFGVTLMLAMGTGRKTKMPFAPALALGAVVGVLWGQSIINLLFHQGT